ncbi:MAG TPA: hypothetical protein VNZ49_09655, partial [Bacteroidia bacterium]|nr:hypothetical protein [Bacteroidia bacterium]
MNKKKYYLLIGLFFLCYNQNTFAQIVTQTYNYTGANQTFVVPCGVFSATVQVWGGGGGGGGTDGSGTPATGGGGGAYATSVLALVPGNTLTMIVGGGGAAGPGCTSGTGGGLGGFGL